jgi:restriction system protein
LTRRRKNGNPAGLLLIAVPLGALWFHLQPGTAVLSEVVLPGFGVVIIGIVAAIVVRAQFGSRVGKPESLPWRAPATASHDQTGSDEASMAWSLQLIKDLEWKRFEELSAAYFRAKGYRVDVAEPGADGGIDFYLYVPDTASSKILAVAQCKAWSSGAIGVRHIRELLGIMVDAGSPLGIFICTSTYTADAKRFAEGKRIQLLDASRLLELIQALPEQDQRDLLASVTRGDFRTPSCPSCGTKLILRTARRGKGAGTHFWGCTNFPRCRYTMRGKPELALQ